MASTNGHSRTAAAGSKPAWINSRTAKEFLAATLPEPSRDSWELARAGKYIGLRNKCPVCGERPPKGMKSNRWRWTSVHLGEHKTTRKAP
jgi:hypothetical protein